MPFTFNTNNRLISRWDGTNFAEEVLTISGADGITVLVDATGFTVSGSQGTISGVLQADINSRVLRAGDTMTGMLTLFADPTASGHAATKQYVDAAAASAAVAIREDGVTENPSANFIDFTHALNVASGVGGATVSVDESALTTVVFLSGDQTISGNKTFADNVIVTGDFSVLGTTTTLNTEELLVEDNIITLNSTVTGTPALNAGFEVERGTSANAQILWDEGADYFTAGISGSLEKIILASDLSGISGALQTDINSRVLRAGDTMTGMLTLFADPTVSGHAATKQYVDAGDAAVSGAFVAADAALSGALTSAYQAADAALSGVVTSGYQAGDAAVSGAFVAADAALSGALQTDIDGRVLRSGDTMIGALTLSGAPTLSGHAATKAYVDAAAAGAAVAVQDHTVSAVASANILDFSTGLTVSGDGNTAHIRVKEDEFTTVVFLSGNQTISGTKTFAAPVVLASGTEPALITSSGAAGEFRWADDYLYVCVATNSWKRVALAQF